MLKRVGLLAMFLFGSLAVSTPVVAQSRDWDDHRGRYEERRDFDRRRFDDRENRRQYQWRQHERWERRYDRDYYRNPYRYYDQRPIYVDPYCPR